MNSNRHHAKPIFFTSPKSQNFFLELGPKTSLLRCRIMNNCALTARLFPAGSFICKANTNENRLIW